jgi:dihydrofolate synthase/folylpolyglutamate synthase
LHIAGTNGKGSVLALSAAALRAQAHRTGTFTSPHWEGALAGIRIDGVPVPLTELEDTFASMQPALAERDDWTHFEVVTALAFQHFARAGVDAAVIEVGLGGRLDATNVLVPTVSVITPIDLEHTTILGSTVTQIAGEKAGIIKPGVPVVMAPQPAEAEEMIRAVAAKHGAPVFEVGKDFAFDRGAASLSGQQLTVAHGGKSAPLRIRLLGAHQAANAATAYAALKVASEHGLHVGDEAIARGFAAAEWPGRFEVLRAEPPVVIDAAHSPHAARALAAALDEYFPGRRVTLILGVSADKDVAGILEPLGTAVDRVIATQSSHPRAMPAAELQRRLPVLGRSAAAEPDPAAALAAALKQAGEDALLVCGSVFLVEQVRAAWFASGAGRMS